MMLNSSKMLFIMMMISGTLITLSSSNWLGMWMGMEINLMSFIPLISKSKNKNSSQAMMTYFLAQSIGSMILLFSVIMNPMFMFMIEVQNNWIKDLIMLSLVIKLGAAPFHWWLPSMMSNLNWTECFIMMTWQKLAPLMVMSNLLPKSTLLYSIVIMSGLIGSVGGLNQTSLRKMLAYSSINHLGWMLMFLSMSTLWYKYLILYSILMMLICYMLNYKNAYFLNQLMTNSPSMMEKYAFIMMMLSIGGLPPFLGFLPKWMTIQSMINSSMFGLITIMMLMSLMTLFYYLRMMIPYILFYSTMNKWMKFKEINKMFLYMTFSINLLLPIFTTLSFF
uniref:NADH-ubiquinone oxidoreductase chain 2 n=1 Tax=Grypocephalus pallipectus TaxID=2813436 RepID=A0A8T9EKM3_9HEMI|nr:NADH dehydrogenase subunit 2 [Grypocephalus pallipectus]UNA71174.1 NADH dehydrogenase subunit 2 [Grypocephalus pallipectus]UPL65766.1 NADH dehydrogenase subunit 2 [Grypocephalus pallipectus]